MAAVPSTVAISPVDPDQLDHFCLAMPHSGEEAMLAVSKEKKLFRLDRFVKTPSSFLTSYSVIQDGSLFLLTPVDPLFLLLPIMEKQSTGDYIDVHACVESSGCSFVNDILDKDLTQLLCICDSKTTGNETCYRLVDSKVLKWLDLKLKAVQNALNAQNASDFVKLKSDDRTVYALGILKEYVSKKWLKLLEMQHGVECPSVLPIKEPEESGVEKKKRVKPAPAANVQVAKGKRQRRAKTNKATSSGAE